MDRIEEMIQKAEADLTPQFAEIDRNEEKRTRQVLDLFRENQVSYRHLPPPADTDMMISAGIPWRESTPAFFTRKRR